LSYECPGANVSTGQGKEKTIHELTRNDTKHKLFFVLFRVNSWIAFSLVVGNREGLNVQATRTVSGDWKKQMHGVQVLASSLCSFNR